MTRFHGTFEGSTSGGGAAISAGGVLVLIGAAVVIAHPHQAAQAMSGAVTAAAIVTGVFILAAAAFVVVKVRRRPAITVCDRPSSRPGLQWQANPNAIPVQPRRELPAPVVNVNIDAGLLAGLMNAMQPQPVRVIAEPVNHQEIDQ